MICNNRIVKSVRAFDLPKGEYAVFGSGLMDVYGLRNSKDIDLIVTKKLFEQMKNNPFWQPKRYLDGGVGLMRDDVEVFYQYSSIPWLEQEKVKEFISRAEKIDDQNMGFGLRCNIAKCSDKFILIHDIRRNFFADNFAENGFCCHDFLLKKYCVL